MAEKVTVGLEVDSKKAEKNVDNLTDGIKDLTKSVDQGNKQIKEGLDDIKETSKSTGEGVRGIGNAIKAAGVGVFLIALESMKELFMQNQVIADSVSSAFEGLALVFNDVFGFITGGLDSVKKLGDAFDKYFGKPIQTATQAFEKFGDAFSKIFGGDFSGALESVQEGFSGLGDAISETGEGFVEAGTDIAKYTVDIKEAAVANVQLSKSAEVAEATNAGLLEKYDRQAEQQRQIRDEERNSIEDRIKANNELGRILEEQNKVMLENANISLKAAQVAFEKNKSTENEVALIQAKNEVMAVEATVEGFRSEQKANDLALDREKIELTNSKLEAESALSFERKKFDAEQETNDIKRIEKLKEINAEERSFEQARLQAVVNEANLGTQAKIDAEIALNEFMSANRQEQVTLDKEYNDAIVKNAKAQVAMQEKINAQSIAAASATFGNLATIFGEESKAGKSAAIAQATIDTFASANAAFKSMASIPVVGPALGAIAAAAAIAGGIKNIQSIKGTKLPTIDGRGGGDVSSSTPSPTQFQSQTPAFNVVGSSGINQIADVVASQEPVKAFVVANDVTTAQSLERNIIEGATL